MKVAVEAEKAGALAGAEEIGGKEWVARPERSSVAAIRLIVWVALRLGRPAARLLLYPICLYFVVFSRKPRRASAKFLERALGHGAGSGVPS